MELKSDVDARVLGYIQTAKPDIPILPMIQNAVQDKWDGNGLARLLADPATRAARIEEIVGFLDKNNFQGLTVDFEEVPAAAQKNLQLFLTEMAAAFAPHRYIIVLAVPFDDDSWPYATYAHIAILCCSWATAALGARQSGSIAGQSWFEETLDKRMEELDQIAPSSLLAAMAMIGLKASLPRNSPSKRRCCRPATRKPTSTSIRKPTTRTSLSSRTMASAMTCGFSMASPPSTRSMPQTYTSRQATHSGGSV
jgi:hypothetical protein